MSDEQIRRASLRNLDLFQDLMQDWTVDNFASIAHTHTASEISDLPESLPASDVYDWAKQPTKPSYTPSEIGLDKVGNFKAVSTEANQELSTQEKANARENIGAGDGDYNNLANKPELGDAAKKDIDSEIISDTSTNIPTTAAVVAYVQEHGGSGETYTEGTGINIDVDNSINVIYGTSAGTACEGNDSRLSDARPASDVYDWAKQSTKPTYDPSEIGAISADLIGEPGGIAELDENGLVPSSQLPSFVDDIVEGYYYNDAFYTTEEHTTILKPESGKIYVDLATNKTYRWGGSSYVTILSDLTLGETSSTAYRGDRGKVAYDHSQLTSGNPHNVTAADIGLDSALTGSIMATNPSSTTKYIVTPIEMRKIFKQILLGGDGTTDFTSAELENIRDILTNVSIID